jgi:hypothetical protein
VAPSLSLSAAAVEPCEPSAKTDAAVSSVPPIFLRKPINHSPKHISSNESVNKNDLHLQSKMKA